MKGKNVQDSPRKSPPKKKRRTNAPLSINSRAKPAQELKKKEIAKAEIELDTLKKTIEFMVHDEEILSGQQNIKKKQKEIYKLNQELSALQNACVYSSRARIKKKSALKDVRAITGDQTIGRDKPGRPRMEELKMNEGLLEFYKELFEEYIVGATQERRRDELITSCRTLDQLLDVVHSKGYSASRTTLHLRFFPLRNNTRQGKLHFKLIPVKFSKPQNKARKRHPGL